MGSVNGSEMLSWLRQQRWRLQFRFVATEKLLLRLRQQADSEAVSHVLAHLKERLAHQDGSLEGVDCSGTALDGSILTKSRLRDARFCGARLRGAYLAYSDLRGCDFSGADLRNANMRGADICGASFRNADLRGVNFARAQLRGCCMDEADLTGANFWCADLREVDFRLALYPPATGH